MLANLGRAVDNCKRNVLTQFFDVRSGRTPSHDRPQFNFSNLRLRLNVGKGCVPPTMREIADHIKREYEIGREASVWKEYLGWLVRERGIIFKKKLGYQSWFFRQGRTFDIQSRRQFFGKKISRR